MNPNLNRNSRSQAIIYIPTAGKQSVHVGGDYFFIYAQSGALSISVNGGVFTNCQAGLVHSGLLGRDDISDIEFYNTSGATVAVSVIFGKGSQSVLGNTVISAADVLSITPAANVLTAAHQYVTAASATFTGKCSLSVTNVGAVDITVGGVTLRAGHSVSFTCERVQDTLPSFTVDASGAGDALVAWTAD